MADVRTSLGTLHLEMTLANDTTAIFAITSAQVNEDLEVPVFLRSGLVKTIQMHGVLAERRCNMMQLGMAPP